MKATQILMEEHRVIERVLNALDLGIQKAQAGNEIRPGFFIEAADFIRGFADGCHHRKEEGVLFKSLVENGLPENSGPVAVMLNDHAQGRVYTQAMRAAAERWQKGDQAAKEETLQNAANYVALLRGHIQKEDAVLFPIADRYIPQSEHDAVLRRFDTVEHEETGEGVHEKYLHLAEKLEHDARSGSRS